MNDPGETESPTAAETAYPAPLRRAEAQLLQHRPGRAPDAPIVGLGLSGGGIRSATFCLGAMQHLARRGHLGRIDFVSTVSGGGYFGAFLGRLFTRGRATGDAAPGLNADEVARHLDFRPTAEPPGAPPGAVLRWLRENGRYLAPKGAGDLLLGGAVLVRNLLSLHLVLWLGLLTAWLLLQGLRELAAVALHGQFDVAFPVTAPSPYAWLVVAVLLLYVAPLAAGYWVLLLATRRPGTQAAMRWSRPNLVTMALGIALLGGLGAWRVASSADDAFALGTGLLLLGAAVVLALALLFAALSLLRARQSAAEADGGSLDIDAHARHGISDRLSTAMLIALVLIVIAAIDSLGQFLYRLLAQGRLLEWLAGLAGALLAAGIAARRMLVNFGGQGDDSRLSLPAGLLAQLAGLLLAGLLLLAVNVLSHAIAWGFEDPVRGLVGGGRIAPERLGNAALIFLLALAFTVFLGRQRRFTNASTHQPLYTARIVRAYLGASNPRRHGNQPDTGVTQVVEGDDIAQEHYWPWHDAAQVPPRTERWRHAPLHLVNVTINETCDGRSQIQQQDRKGTGMAIGPCGLSVGVRHHLVCAGGEQCVFPGDGFQVFGHSEGAFAGEKLSLGRWIGISGAAFSTGLGARTNLGLSLLLGLANVRLGYWWNSGIDRAKSGESWLHRQLPVYGELLDEFGARFHGTARRRWYLSDGGHFENLGGYELIRRRLQSIILIDAEADPDYRFQGLAGLIRKARIDFGAEIRFLDEEELDGLLDDDTRRYIGSLAELRRGRWANEPFDEPNLRTRRRPRQVLDPPDRRRFSRAHAALARVYYDGSQQTGSWLLYIKATVTGDEPADLLEFHANQPDFPHQTTADQFFDEAQWESYRRLGEHVLERLLPENARLDELLGLVPRSA